jgi:hypothetical protein
MTSGQDEARDEINKTREYNVPGDPNSQPLPEPAKRREWWAVRDTLVQVTLCQSKNDAESLAKRFAKDYEPVRVIEAPSEAEIEEAVAELCHAASQDAIRTAIRKLLGGE